MFFKKDKLKFYCELPEIKQRYPIIQARQYKFNWFKKSSQAFKEVAKERSSYEQISGVVKCPGISPVMQQGYIVQSWFDLTIKVHENGFEFFIPQGLFSYLKERNFNKTLISGFSSEDPAHAIPMPEIYSNSLVKITLPWSVSIPKGWKLMFMPIPYPDSVDFMSVHGILESGDLYNINAIIKCNTNYNREFTIPAGTPLLQLIPIKTVNAEIEILDYNADIQQKEISNKYLANHQFIVKH